MDVSDKLGAGTGFWASCASNGLATVGEGNCGNTDCNCDYYMAGAGCVRMNDFPGQTWFANFKGCLRPTTTTQAPSTTRRTTTAPPTTTVTTTSEMKTTTAKPVDYVDRAEFEALEKQVLATQEELNRLARMVADASNTMSRMNRTVTRVEGGQSDLASCAANYLNGVPTTTRPVTSMEPTTKKPTTMKPTTTSRGSTMPTTTADENLAAVESDADMKCVQGRSFKLKYTSLENCVLRCQRDQDCMYATVLDEKHCIGCDAKPDVYHAGFKSYKVNRARRSLMDELEMLRAENAELRAQLARN